MTTIYRCDICGREFGSTFACRHHEAQHFDGEERVKYELVHDSEENICDYCAKSYYVYGCELNCDIEDCSAKTNYKDFVAVAPLHNKRLNGGV